MGHFRLALCIHTSTGDDLLCIGRESIGRGVARVLSLCLLYNKMYCIDTLGLISAHPDLIKEFTPPLCMRMSEGIDYVGNERDRMLFCWVNLRYCTIVHASMKISGSDRLTGSEVRSGNVVMFAAAEANARALSLDPAVDHPG